MKCVIPGANIKILARAIHALAKIGDEMYVQPQQKCLSFRSVNMANSAYADFTFNEDFFSCYMFKNHDDEDSLKSKISIRSAMTVFKTFNTMDKQVETCHINMSPNAPLLRITLKYRNSIKKTHLLPILDCEKIQATYVKDGAPNQLFSQSRVFLEAVQNFQQNLIEITMQVMSNKVLLRNYIDETSSVANKTRTQLVLGSGEFDRYQVNQETVITFCMKELRAILTFAEATGLPITMYFKTAGKPIVFFLKNSCLEANLVLSTLSPDVETQSDTTASVKHDKPMRKRVRRKTIKNPIKSFGCSGSEVDENHRKSMDNAAEAKESPSAKEPNEIEIIDMDDVAPPNGVPNKTVNNSKSVVRSVFSNVVKRKSVDLDRKEEEDKCTTDVEADESIPSSPPRSAKIAKIVFKKCFQTTLEPGTEPEHDVLVDDSDDNGD